MSEPSKEVATLSNDLEGLEDVDQSDLTTPFIKIDHEAGHFQDSLTNETFTEFQAIILGLAKQRILWPPTPGADKEGPICRSYDHKSGQPDDPKWLAKHNGTTALAVSGWSIEEVQAGNLSCADCKLKEWDTHPSLGTPWCSEQFTFPILRITEDGGYAPAIITFQKTGLKPCKSYVSGFVAAGRPLYTAITKVTAVHQRKGTVEFVTPSFTKLSDSDPSEYPEYSKMLSDIRGFITTPRTRRDEATEVSGQAPSTDAPAQPAKRAKPEATEPTATNTRPEVEDDEEEPF